MRLLSLGPAVSCSQREICPCADVMTVVRVGYQTESAALSTSFAKIKQNE